MKLLREYIRGLLTEQQPESEEEKLIRLFLSPAGSGAQALNLARSLEYGELVTKFEPIIESIRAYIAEIDRLIDSAPSMEYDDFESQHFALEERSVPEIKELIEAEFGKQPRSFYVQFIESSDYIWYHGGPKVRHYNISSKGTSKAYYDALKKWAGVP